jgi:hypothetical protein
MLGRWTTSSQLRAQMSVGALPHRTRVVLHSAEAQRLEQSVPGRSAFESKRHATVVQIAGDWLRHWVVHGGTLAKAKAEDVL